MTRPARPPAPLREHRSRVGLTQLQLAARAGVSIQTVSLAERGIPLTAAMAAKLAPILGVSPEQLLAEARS